MIYGKVASFDFILVFLKELNYMMKLIICNRYT